MRMINSDYKAEFEAARQALLSKTYLVNVKPVVVDQATTHTGMVEVEQVREPTISSRSGVTMHVSEHSPNSDFYEELLTSSGNIMGKEEEVNLSMNTATRMYLTAPVLAAIVSTDGTFSFVDPSDFANLYNALEGFAVRMEETTLMTISRKKSDIDMKPYIVLADLVKPKALLMKKYGEGIFKDAESLDIQTRMRSKEGKGRANTFLKGPDPRFIQRSIRFSGKSNR